MPRGPIYAVGDIHGHLDKLDRALNLIARDGGTEARIVFLGDTCDRGPDSAGVIDRIARGIVSGRNWACVLGNHDRMLLRFLERGTIDDPRVTSGKSWFAPAMGGLGTLASYGIAVDPQEDMFTGTDFEGRAELVERTRAAVPELHRAFLRDLPLWIEAEDLLFVHAGLRPGAPLAEQTEDDLVWIRDPFLTHDAPFDWLVIHGHSPVETPTHFGNRIDADGGAAFGRPLVPVLIDETGAAFQLTDEGRLPMPRP